MRAISGRGNRLENNGAQTVPEVDDQVAVDDAEVDALTEVEPGRKRITDQAGSSMQKIRTHGNTDAK